MELMKSVPILGGPPPPPRPEKTPLTGRCRVVLVLRVLGIEGFVLVRDAHLKSASRRRLQGRFGAAETRDDEPYLPRCSDSELRAVKEAVKAGDGVQLARALAAMTHWMETGQCVKRVADAFHALLQVQLDRQTESDRWAGCSRRACGQTDRVGYMGRCI
jgi:hypothetical protein